jgi:hypothetical protein
MSVAILIRDRVVMISSQADDVSGDYGTADNVVTSAGRLGRGELFAALSLAGVEGARPRDSKQSMLERLRRRLTARVRARERAEV